jgi:uncharacterized membrane protein YfcA
MDPLLAIALLAVATSTLSGVFGMAGGLVLMAACAALLPVTDAMLVHGATQIVANGFRFWLLRGHVHWRGALWFALGGLAPLALFRAFEIAVDPGTVYLLLGGIPLAASLVPARLAPRFDRPGQAVLCGAATTVGQLSAGATGATLDVFFTRAGLGRHAVVATKALVQTLGHAAKLLHFGLLAAATPTPTSVTPAALVALAAAALAGTLVGRRFLEGVGEGSFRVWTRRLVLALSAGFLAQGLRMVALPGP